MLKIIGIIFAILVVALAGILVYAATKPDPFRYARSISIKAPPEKVFALINNLQSWTAWSPYEKKDPTMKRSFSGPSFGTGAAYAWDGDNNVGQGRMEIVEVVPSSKIVFKLDFIRPFEGHHKATFTMAPQGDTTNVTWALEGQNIYIGKVMSVFLDMDKMVGKDFENGLASLKTLAEK